MLDLSNILTEAPEDTFDYRYVDAGNGIKGWLPMSDADKEQRDLARLDFQQRLIDKAWASLRSERNRLLIESDAHVFPDRWSSYTAEQQAAWASYRQALRDVPQNTTDPNNPTWPVKPT